MMLAPTTAGTVVGTNVILGGPSNFASKLTLAASGACSGLVDISTSAAELKDVSLLVQNMCAVCSVRSA